MRINIVLGPFLPTPPGPAGAVEKRWTQVARHLADSGCDVNVFSRAYPDLPPLETSGRLRIHRKGGTNRRASLPINLIGDLQYSLRTCLSLFPAEITVSNTFWLPTLAPIVRAKVGGKLVVNQARFPKKHLLMYRYVDAVSAVSSPVADAVSKVSVPLGRKTVTIPNPVDVTVFKPNHARRKSNNTAVVYHGRIHPEKGLGLLVTAVSQLSNEFPNIKLRLIGPVAIELGGGGAKYKALLESLSKGVKLEFVSPVRDPKELAKQLQSAAVYCYPSKADLGESFGISPLEAMACGLPTIVSNLECFRDFVEPGVNAFVFDHRAANSVDLLAADIKRVLENQDSDQLTTLKCNAARRANDFSYMSVSNRYLQFFTALSAS